jgi:hypothetical protein
MANSVMIDELERSGPGLIEMILRSSPEGTEEDGENPELRYPYCSSPVHTTFIYKLN